MLNQKKSDFVHSTILIFIDGIGIGEPDPEKNTFFKYNFKFLNEIFGGIPSLEKQYWESENSFLFPTDACLGIPGFPQSGTGQTSIFAGINAPKLAGIHHGPHPHSATVEALREKNIFKEFKDRNLKVTFANAYPKIFFDYINSGKKRLSATSLSCLMSGVKLKSPTDLRRGKALSAEIDNFRWVKSLNYNLPIIKPETAARRLFRLAEKKHFTLFEYFLTDHFGHGRNKELMDYSLKILDDFLFYILKNIEDRFTLIICSDHGNLEDVSVKSHTRNPALTISAGKSAKELSKKIKNISQIKGAILDLYK